MLITQCFEIKKITKINIKNSCLKNLYYSKQKNKNPLTLKYIALRRDF